MALQRFGPRTLLVPITQQGTGAELISTPGACHMTTSIAIAKEATMSIGVWLCK